MTKGKKGVVINEPSVVAYDNRDKKVIATGNKAYNMIGRTPNFISIIKPLKDGVVYDGAMAQSLINSFMVRITKGQLFRPRIIICIPSFITEVESRAVVDIAVNTGSRNIHLLEEPVAGVMGAGIDVSESLGTLVLDIGGGTTDIAIVSLNGIVDAISIRTAGNSLNTSIIRYMANRYRLIIGELTAENIKKDFMNVYNPSLEKNIKVKGMSIYSNLPEIIYVSEAEMFLAVQENLIEIVNAIKILLERTNPSLIDDICNQGAIMTGGGSMLKGLDRLISKQINVHCRVAENPMECVAIGTSIAFKNMDKLLDGFEYIKIKNLG
ncbi:MAG: rod shape-determining protein [Ruminococcus sp.]|nr:rod shape-determining protein [Ruminococcus sp.]